MSTIFAVLGDCHSSDGGSSRGSKEFRGSAWGKVHTTEELY